MQADHSSWEETRIRAATLLSKVFLVQHLGPLLQLFTCTALWLTLDMHVMELDDILAEAEMMKNFAVGHGDCSCLWIDCRFRSNKSGGGSSSDASNEKPTVENDLRWHRCFSFQVYVKKSLDSRRQ